MNCEGKTVWRDEQILHTH